MKQVYKKETGITLIVLMVTIVIMLILATITIEAINGGLFEKAGEAVSETKKTELEIAISKRFMVAKSNPNNKTTQEIFEETKNNLGLEGATYKIGSFFMQITTQNGEMFTLLDDGTIQKGKQREQTILDIADGSIELYSDKYKQGDTEVTYTGKYIITGETTTNTVKVMDTGKYYITIRDLKIDVGKENIIPFNGNAGRQSTGCFVNLTLKGNNYFNCGGWVPAIAFANATPNINGVTNGSTLTIDGDGFLEARGGVAIGSGYGYQQNYFGDVCNIIINSGNINAIGSTNGIGNGTNGKNVNNIIINGGTIYAKGGSRGISSFGGTMSNITVKGGNVFSYQKITTPATNGSDDLYLTTVQLSGVTKRTQVTSITTSDNIEYGTEDMYTMKENPTSIQNDGGVLYLYLPATGETPRTITVTAGGNTYSGSVVTATDATGITTLTKQ